MKLQYYIMENVAIHGMGGNDAYKVVPKYEKISKINEITIHHVYLNLNLQHFRSRSLAVISFQNLYPFSDQNG